MLKRIALAAISLLLIASPAFSAKPVPEPSTIDVSAGSDLTYGGFVSFDTSIGDIGRGDLYITVVCTQGSNVVYQYSSYDLGFSFPLVDLGGQGLEWTGGSADCLGSLRYIEVRGKNHIIEELDVVAFYVQG